MKYKHLIFDWDGTIAMTLHLWLAGYRQALQNQGHTILDSVIARDFFYEHDKGMLKYPDVDFETLVDETRAHVFSHLYDLKLYERAKKTIQELNKTRITLSLVSSSSRRLLEKGLKRHNLGDQFVSVIGSDDVTKHKPDPEAFKQTMSHIGAIPEETLIIGDAKTDILAGKAAGTKTCLFTPDENRIFYNFAELRATDPDINIKTMSELLSKISLQ